MSFFKDIFNIFKRLKTKTMIGELKYRKDDRELWVNQ